MTIDNRADWYRIELGEDGMATRLISRNYSPDKVTAVLELSRAQSYQLDLLIAQFAWKAAQDIEDLEMRLAAEAVQDNIAVDLVLVEDYDVS